MTMAEPKLVHEGKNIKKIRTLLDVKQTTLAKELGRDWNQKKISLLEDEEKIEPDLLEKIARALNVTPEAIRNFNEDSAVNIFATNNHGKDQSSAVNFQCTFNPIDKWVETIEENKRLYEQLLNSEKEKVALLIKTNEALQKLLS